MLYLISLLFCFIFVNPTLGEDADENNTTIRIFGDDEDDRDDDFDLESDSEDN